MPRKKSQSIPKKAANRGVKKKVVTKNDRSKEKVQVKKMERFADETSRKGSPHENLLNKPPRSATTLKKVQNLNLFQCRICSLKFGNQIALQNHKERFGKATHPCTSCGTKFSDEEQLGIHFKHAHVGVTIPGYTKECHMCKQVFTNTAFLHAHLFHNHPRQRNVYKILTTDNNEGFIGNGATKGGKQNGSFDQITNTVWYDDNGSIEGELEIEKNKNRAKAVTCKKKRNQLNQLENHVESVINSYNEYHKVDRDNDLRAKYGCKPCCVSVKKLSENEIPPFVCKLCSMTFPSEELKNNHMTNDHILVESVICDKRLPTESWMRRHFREEHLIGTDENEMCACGKNMHGHEALEEHFFQHSMRSYESVLKPLTVAFKCKPLAKTEVCDNCGKSFWLKTCLEIHTRGCSKVIDDSSEPVALQVISRPETDQRQKHLNELICRICWAQFPTPSALASHVQFYARPKQYRCNLCGTSFNGKSMLQTHTRDAHTYHIAHYYSCYCTTCDQGFAKKIYRRIHIAHAHGDKYPITITAKPMIDDGRVHDKGSEYDSSGRKCQICNLQFVSRKRFIEHTNYFNNEEEIVCRICDQRFQGQHNFHRHYKLCHYPSDIRETYQHKCPLCKEGFAFKIHLKAHGKHVHNKNMHGINLMRKRNDVIRKSGKPDDCSVVSSGTGVARYHMCAVCEVSFPDLDFLAAHQIEYEMDGKFVCSRCGRRCGTPTLLLDHLSLNHSTVVKESVKCRRCDEFFLTPAAWLSHIKHCHMADVIHPSELYLEAHINFPNKIEVSEFVSLAANNKISKVTPSVQASPCITEINSFPLSPKCISKENSEESTSQFTNKLFIRHTFFRCEVCAAVFDSETALESHRNHLHKITSKATQINSLVVLTQVTGMNNMNPMTMGHLIPVPKECPVQIIHEEHNKHRPKTINSSSNSGSRNPLKCEPCGFVFPTLTMLKLHQDWVHSSSFPKIKCTDVGYRTSHAALSSTIDDCTRHNPLFVNSSPIVRSPQTLGASFEQQQSNIIIQTVSMPISTSEPKTIVNVGSESTSCDQGKSIETNFVHSEGSNADKSKLDKSFSTVMTNDWENNSRFKRNNCLANDSEDVRKRIKQEPVGPTGNVSYFSDEKV